MKLVVKVEARKVRNDTGLDLSAGDHVSVVASGTWRDWTIWCGPDGYERAYLAPFRSLRRCRAAQWFELIGQIGKEATPQRLGASGSFVAETDGRLFLYANDWRGLYWNNSGFVTAEVTVSRAVGQPKQASTHQ